MKLEFSDKRINEFKEAHLHFKNDGKSFEASQSVGDYLLTKTVTLDGADVPVFAEVKEVIKKEKKINAADTQ